MPIKSVTSSRSINILVTRPNYKKLGVKTIAYSTDIVPYLRHVDNTVTSSINKYCIANHGIIGDKVSLKRRYTFDDNASSGVTIDT